MFTYPRLAWSAWSACMLAGLTPYSVFSRRKHWNSLGGMERHRGPWRGIESSLHRLVCKDYTPALMPIQCCFFLRAAALACPLFLAGCQSFESPLATPAATTTQRTENRMKKFDPFPDTRVGPRVAGLRPPGYRKPISEPARSRQQAKANTAQANSEPIPQQVRPPAE